MLGGCIFLVLQLCVTFPYDRLITRKNIAQYKRIRAQDRLEEELAQVKALSRQVSDFTGGGCRAIVCSASWWIGSTTICSATGTSSRRNSAATIWFRRWVRIGVRSPKPSRTSRANRSWNTSARCSWKRPGGCWTSIPSRRSSPLPASAASMPPTPSISFSANSRASARQNTGRSPARKETDPPETEKGKHGDNPCFFMFRRPGPGRNRRCGIDF